MVLGSDEDFWVQVGIDPIRIMTSSGTFYTLRCYLDDRPIFLGRNGRISVFSSERALARYLADEHDHDLADLSTYDDIRTAATDGSLAVEVTDDNIYVLSGLADDIADGPDAVDATSWTWPSSCSATSATTRRRARSTRRSRQAARWASWWPTCSSPARSASPRPRTPRRYGNGRSWSNSSTGGSARVAALDGP